MTPRTVTEEVLNGRVRDWVSAGHPEISGLGHSCKRSLLCPAAIGSHGTEVFGVFDPSLGQVRFLPEVISLPQVTRDVVGADQLCERARLSARCETYRCQYWQGGCRLGWFVSKVEVTTSSVGRMCAISQRCRWRAENGERVCGGCAEVRALPLR